MTEALHKFEVSKFARLAAPMVVSRAGLAAMGIADGIMVGRFSPDQFAALSITEGTLGRVLDVFVAALIGGLTVVPRHFAMGDAEGAFAFWRRTLPVSLVLGVVGFGVACLAKSIMLRLGQSPELAAAASPLAFTLGVGFPAALVAISSAVYLEGVNRPAVVAVCVGAANLLNILFNWLLIGGHWGLPSLGALGSTVATSVVRLLLAVVLVTIALRTNPGQHSTVVSDELAAERALSADAQWKMGAGTGVTVAALVALAASLTVFAGWMGVASLATFSAAWTLVTPMMLVALGLADATNVYVSSEVGRAGDRSAAAMAWACTRASAIAIGSIALICAVAARPLSRAFGSDEALVAPIAAVIPLACLVVTADSVGFAISASLRSFREVLWPVMIDLLAMVALVALAMGFALRLGMGVQGLYLAMFSAGAFRAVALCARFAYRVRRSDAPRPAGVNWSLDV